MKRLLVACGVLPFGVVLCALNVTAACVQAEEAPSAVAQEAPSLPEAVEETVVAQPALLDQLREQTMTAEEAWDTKLLDENSVMTLLENSLASWREQDQDQRLRVELVSVLMKHAPQQLEVTTTTSLRIKRALADYYANMNDKRAVGLYEELATRDEYSAYEKGSLLGTLGSFQSSLRDSQAAIATFLRAHDWFVKAQQKHSIGEMLINAARVYRRDGEETKARGLYERAQREGDGWMSAIATFDQADGLISKGNYREARELLERLMKSGNSKQMAVGTLYNLGHSYYAAKDFETARKYYEEAIAEYQSQEDSGQRSPIGVFRVLAQEDLHTIEQWAQGPFACEPSELYQGLWAEDKHLQPVSWHFYVRSFDAIPLQVSVDNSRVKVRLVESDGPAQLNVNGEKEVIVEVDPKWLKEDVKAAVVVTSASFPSYEVRLPLYIEVR